jgi:hypothetical protein
MHFFSQKTLTLCVLTLLTLLATVLLDSGTSHAYAATHGASTISLAATNDNQAVVPAATVQCPSGAACIFTDNLSDPVLIFYNPGVYQLHLLGYHDVYNNGIGSARLLLCTDWYGQVCPWLVPAGNLVRIDFTPINSLRFGL